MKGEIPDKVMYFNNQKIGARKNYLFLNGELCNRTKNALLIGHQPRFCILIGFHPTDSESEVSFIVAPLSRPKSADCQKYYICYWQFCRIYRSQKNLGPKKQNWCLINHYFLNNSTLLSLPNHLYSTDLIIVHHSVVISNIDDFSFICLVKFVDCSRISGQEFAAN